VANVMFRVGKAELEVEAISSLIFPQAWRWSGARLRFWVWPRRL
jgi:hypothetical protein